jgi:biotin transporter BioY
MVSASLFGAATAANAYVSIPVFSVPITLQTLVLMVVAAFSLLL